LPTKIPYVVSERADGATSTGSELTPAARPDQGGGSSRRGRCRAIPRSRAPSPTTPPY
jgi:hypothetical protein